MKVNQYYPGLLLFLSFSMFIATLDAQDSLDGPDGATDDANIELNLKLAVTAPNENQPMKIVLIGSVRNNSESGISISPFPGNDVAVLAAHQWPVKLVSKALDPSEEIQVAANTTETVFQLNLSEIIGQRIGDEAGTESNWSWNWQGPNIPHPHAPVSPLFQRFGTAQDTQPDVTFWFELQHNGKTYQSNRLTIDVEVGTQSAPKINRSETAGISNQLSLITDQSKTWEIHKVESGYLATTEVNLATVVSFPVPDELHALFDPFFQLSGESAGPPSNDAGTWNVRLAGGEETKIEVSAELKEYLNDAAQHLEKVRDRLNSIEFRIVEDISRTPPINPGSSKTQFETLKLELKDNFYQASLTETTTSAPGPTGFTSISTDSLLEGEFRLNLVLDQPGDVVKKMFFSQEKEILKSLEQVSQPKDFLLSRKTRMENFSFDRAMTFVKPASIVASAGAPSGRLSPQQLISFDSTRDDSSGTPKVADGNDARSSLPGDVRIVKLRLKTWPK